MTDTYTGGCLCGAIRFETTKPLRMFLCHCRACQQSSGSAFVPVAVVPKATFRITKGEPTWYAVPRLRGGENRRGFCPTCGSRLFGGGTDEVQGVTAASFDDPGFYKPMGDAFVTQAQSWDHMDPALPKHDTYAVQPPVKGTS